MYSRFGKFLPYRFHILLSKDEILSPGKQKNKPFRASPVSAKEDPHRIYSPAAEPVKPSFMFRSQSRDDYYKIQPKASAPPVGYYNLNYSYITKSPKSAIFKQRTKVKSRKILVPQTPFELNTNNRSNRGSSISFKRPERRSELTIKASNEKIRLNSLQNIQAINNLSDFDSPVISRIPGRNSIKKVPRYLNSYNAENKTQKEDKNKADKFLKPPMRKTLFNSKKRYSNNFELNSKSAEKLKVEENSIEIE